MCTGCAQGVASAFSLDPVVREAYNFKFQVQPFCITEMSFSSREFKIWVKESRWP